MSASLGLFRLQQIDRQIDHINSQIDSIRQTLENDTELRELINQLEIEQTKNHQARRDYKNIEAEVEALKIKIEYAESSLYSGKVQNPKELLDLQKDVASLKKHFVTLEESELEALVNAENSDKDLQSAKTKLELIKARLNNEHKNLSINKTALTDELDRLAVERDATQVPIDGSLLIIYEGLKQQKRGVAVAEISDNTCALCGTTLNAALQQTARSQNQLAYCSSCGRILYSN